MSAPNPLSATPAPPQRPAMPDNTTAIADFNSLPDNRPPFRDAPSVIIGHLSLPDHKQPEPDWVVFLAHYMRTHRETGNGYQSVADLQYLFLLISRVLLPNAIVENRQLLLEVFTVYPGLQGYNRLRYDAFDNSPRGKDDVDSIHVVVAPSGGDHRNLPFDYPVQEKVQQPLALDKRFHIPPRSIFASTTTPNGTDFVAWLIDSPLPLVNGAELGQMAHQKSQLDIYMTLPEVELRALNLLQLVRRTTRLLQMWFWLTGNNVRLQQHKSNQWTTFGEEM
ncbi:hypothetical protein M011DRAFT_470239 [Sporormia fimetaria CBS 119925]|uniref:Uncharacterized protein n=1 Tax=Sporormia fimetaria CBS 119925 TaxID=1340428 RepID=A0A6A6V542_9PLEO|nr:hypothetical protein M011DRAFT_470239 [Sporormia fimetaria CBS 119925]